MNDFAIVFEKLGEITAQEQTFAAEATGAEIEEIAQLRQAVLEISEPPPVSYTIS